MLLRLLRTGDDIGPFVARMALAIVIFAHGAQKALGWFGGFGIAGTVGYLGGLGVPSWLGTLAIAAEFLGSIALVIGLLGRVAAFGIIVDMIAAVSLVHWKNGFFMNWNNNHAGEGFEYHILAVGLALVVLLKGSGAMSIDRAVTHRAFGVSDSRGGRHAR